MTLKYNPSTVGTASSDGHGAYHLANNPEQYEPQRTNHFEFVVTDVNAIIKAGYVGTEKDAVLKNAQEVLRLSVDGAFVPHYSQNALTIQRGNTQMKFAGVMSFQNGTIDFNDYIGAQTKEILMAWQNLSGNIVTEKVGLVQDYKKTCYLLEYSADYQLVRTWVLQGCWISSLSEDGYSQSSENINKIHATIEYDKAFIDTSNAL